MVEEQPDKFRLGRDEDADETEPYPTEMESAPADRKRTFTGFYIILLVLIVGILAAYFDLYRRVTRSQHVGTNQAEGLDTRLSALSVKQAALEEQLAKKIDEDKQMLKGLDDQFIKARGALKATQEQLAQKTNKSELNAAVKKGIEQVTADTGETLKKLNALKINLEKLESNLAATKEKLFGEIGEITLQLDRSSKNLIELQSKTNKLATAKIDKKTADNLIKKRLESQQPVSGQVAKTLSGYQEEIDVLKRNIFELKKNATIYENENLKMKRQLKTLNSGTLNKPPNGTLSPSSAKPGDLLQENLKD